MERTFEVRKQKTLSFAKTVRLCFSGISHRFFRSVLTLAVVALAVAFFMSLLTENGFVLSTGRGVSAEIVRQREAITTLTFLFSVPSSIAHARTLAQAAGDPERLAVHGRIAGWTADRVARLAEPARTEHDYLAYFNRLDAGRRTILVRRHQGRDIFHFLADPDVWNGFMRNLRDMRGVRVPGGTDALRSFLDGYESYLDTIESFTDDWRVAVEALTAASMRITDGEPIEAWLVGAEPAEREAWRTQVVRGGFPLTAEQLERVRSRLAEEALRQEVERRLNRPEARARWARIFMERPPLNEKMQRLTHPLVVSDVLENAYSPEVLDGIAGRIDRERRLTEVERRLTARAGGRADAGIGTRQIFLLIISFVVCLVGITNAMLMAITERFREIATMKCLGATDGFILTQFIIEAALQGIAGGLVGMVVGLLLSTLKNAADFGRFLFVYFPAQHVLLASVSALAAGLVVSTLASIYPSWTASRMAPMEAMRVE